MLDLSTEQIESHWQTLSTNSKEIVFGMDGQENWTLDDRTEVEQAIVSWGKELSEAKLENLEDDPEKAIVIMGFLKSSRALYMLSQLEEKIEGFTVDLLYEAIERIESKKGDTRMAQVFRDRITSLYRVDLLRRVFSPDRIEQIAKVIKNTALENGGLYER